MSLIDLSLEFDSSVLSRVLAKGRSTGARFSEVFIEDKRSMGASLDDALGQAGWRDRGLAQHPRALDDECQAHNGAHDEWPDGPACGLYDADQVVVQC